VEAFRREGDYWALGYAGTTVRLADTKGMRYLARLLADPGREFHALDLVTAPAPAAPAAAGNPDAGLATTREGSAGPMLDAAAKAAYRRHMAELREELEEAERFGDPERAARARADLQMLADHVTAAVGLGGRDRRTADAAERARVSVTKAVKTAIRRIGNHHPALGSHLRRSVRTGIYCCYEPDPHSPPWWEAGSARASVPSRRPGPLVGTSATTLIGRAVELTYLVRLLKDALSGRGALVVLAGDAGIGKTRLAAEIVRHAADQRARTALGRCAEAENSLALLPFGQILETVTASMSDGELRAAVGDEAVHLAKVLPLLRRRLSGIPEGHPLPPAAERQALLAGITTFLRRAAGDQGLVLLLDDLQWADETTLACLEYLAEQLTELPVLVLGTARSAGLEPGRPLAYSWERLHRLRLWNHLRLEPLAPPAVAAMLEALADRAPSDQLTQAVVDHTAGNPFFVEELYWHLGERALLFEDQGLVSADPAALRGEVPDSVRLVLGHRLAGLGDNARAMLDVAAVIGRSVDYQLLSEVVRLDADALVAAVENAEHARLLEVTVHGDRDCLVLVHDLVRHTLLQSLSLPRCRRLHARVADALEQRMDTDEALAADLVHHLLQADTVEAARVLRALRRAGHQAMARAAFADAYRHFDRALARSPVDDERERAGLLAERGRAARALGRLPEALADLQEALATFERLHAPEAASALVLDLSRLLDLLGRHHDSAKLAQRALDALGTAPSRLRCQLLALTARWWAFDGDFAAADLALDQAAACAAELDDPAVTDHLLHARSWTASTRFDCTESAATGLTAVRLLGEAGEEWEASQADGLTEGLVRFLRRVGHHTVELWVLRNTATVALLRSGDLDTYATFVEQWIETHRALGTPWPDNVAPVAGMAAFWRGDWASATAHLEEGARLELGSAHFGRCPAALLRLDAYRGGIAAVRERWTHFHLGRFPRSWPSAGDRLMAIAGAEAWVAVGEHAEAAALYPQIAEASAHGTLIAWDDLRLLATAAGVSAAAGGNWDLAEAHFAEALRQADTLPHRIEQAEARRLWAEALLTGRLPQTRTGRALC